MSISVGYFVGSLSKQSINRSLAACLLEVAPASLEFTQIAIGDLPLYNRDFDSDYPEVALAFKKQITDSDALLFVTPEYNRSVPGVLKNAIDWGSRPSGRSAFAGKPAGVIGTSTGGPGTAMAQQHLRNSLAFLDVATMGQPEGFIQYTPQRFAPDGTLIDESTRQFLRNWMAAYGKWVKRFVD